MSERSIPAAIKYQLRKEVNFGCAVCGCPILEYHHIIPWVICKEHDPKNMVALCPTHHTQLGKASRDVARDHKLFPYNHQKGWVGDKFFGQALPNQVQIGKVRINSGGTVLQCYDKEILSLKDDDGVLGLSAFFPDSDFHPELEIKDNEFNARLGRFYDIEFRTNFLKIHKIKGKNYFTLDLRKEIAEIKFSVNILGQDHTHTQSQSKMPQMSFGKEGSLTIKGGNAFLIGSQKHAVNATNHALLKPKPYLTEWPAKKEKKQFAMTWNIKP